MKKLFLITLVFMTLIFSGCVAMDVADIFLEDTPVHYAEVQSITKGKDKTTVFFVDGFNYEICNYVYVRPGDMVKIFELDNGEYSAEVE